MSRADALLSSVQVLWQIALNFWPSLVFLILWGFFMQFVRRGGRE